MQTIERLHRDQTCNDGVINYVTGKCNPEKQRSPTFTWFRTVPIQKIFSYFTVIELLGFLKGTLCDSL